MDPYEILGIKRPCSKEDIKARYHQLAMKHHPDKLQHLSKEDIEVHEQEFKRISCAYQMLSKDTYEETCEWKKMWESVPIFNDPEFMNDILQNVMNGVKNYVKTVNNEHYINVEVSLEEVYQKKNKKLRLFLTDFTDPIFITINCGEYPFILYRYETTNIHISLKLITHEIYTLDTLSNSNDIFCTLYITLYDYINGCTKHMRYLDNSMIDVVIESCSEKTIEIPNKGLNNTGKLTIFIKTVLPSRKSIDTLEDSKKQRLYKYLKKISASHHYGKII